MAPDEPFDVRGHAVCGRLRPRRVRSSGSTAGEEPGSGACEWVVLSARGKRGPPRRRAGAYFGPETATRIVVGEVTPGEERSVALRFPGMPAGGFQLYLAASAWNATSAATSVGSGVWAAWVRHRRSNGRRTTISPPLRCLARRGRPPSTWSRRLPVRANPGSEASAHPACPGGTGPSGTSGRRRIPARFVSLSSRRWPATTPTT